MEEANNKTFDLFVSYSTKPDYRLVRELESFLETFHRLPTPDNIGLRPISVCVDGSDFKTPRRGRGEMTAEVETVIDQHLALSSELLVLCSSDASHSKWVDHEVQWFLQHRGPEYIRLAVTEGVDPDARPEEVFSETLMEADLHERVWYDFRGYKARQARQWQKVRDFDDNRTRLAADLLDLRAGDVQPIWYREQKRVARRRIRATIGVALILLVLTICAAVASVVAFHMRDLAQEREADAKHQLGAAFLEHAWKLWENDRHLEAQLIAAYTTGFAGLEKNEYFDEALLRENSSEFFKAQQLSLFRPIPLRWQSGGSGVHHDSEIVAIAFSPDDTLLATGSAGSEVRIWDVESGRLRAELSGHTDRVTQVKFLPDGAHLMTCSEDKTCIAWELDSYTRINTISAHRDRITGLSIARTGNLIATAGVEDKTVRIWTWPDLTELKTLEFEHKITAVSFSPTQDVLAIASMDYVIHLWDTNSWKRKGKLEKHKKYEQTIWGIAFNRDGTRLASYGLAALEGFDAESAHSRGSVIVRMGSDVFLWDMTTLRFLDSRQGFFPSIKHAIFSPVDDILAVADGKQVQLIDINDDNATSTEQINLGHVNSLDFSSDGELIATAGKDGLVRLYSLTTQTPVKRHDGHSGSITGIAFLPDSQTLISTAVDSTLAFWDAKDGTQVRERLEFTPDASDLCVSSDGHTVAFIDRGTVVKRDLDSRAVEVLGVDMPIATTLAFEPTGNGLFVGYFDGSLRLWYGNDFDQIREFVGHSLPISGLAFDEFGLFLFSSSGDKTVKIWNIADASLLASANRENYFKVLQYSGGYLLEMEEGHARVLDTRTGEHVYLTTPKGPTCSVAAMSPIDPIVVCAFKDGRLEFNDVRRKTRTEFPIFMHNVTNAIFDPTGNLIAFGDAGGRVTVIENPLKPDPEPVRLGTFVVDFEILNPKGNHLVIGGPMKTWNVDVTSGTVEELSPRKLTIKGDFSSDGRLFAFSNDIFQKNVTVQETRSEEPLLKIDMDSPVTKFRLSPDGNTLAVCILNRIIRFYDLIGNTLLYETPNCSADVVDMSFAADSRIFVSVCDDNSMNVFDVSNWKKHEIVILPGKPPSRIYVGAKGTRVYVGHQDGEITVWSLTAGQLQSWFPGQKSKITAISAHEGSRMVATGGSEVGDTITWKGNNPQALQSIKVGRDIQGIKFSEVGHVTIWREGNPQPVQSIEVGRDIQDIKFSEDGNVVVIMTLDQVLTTLVSPCKTLDQSLLQIFSFSKGSLAFKKPDPNLYGVKGWRR